MLLKYDVKANAKRRSDIAPILFAIDAITKNESKKENITQCITKLVEHNADVNCAFQDGDFAGETPIISAIRLDQIDLAKLLIEKKANVSACAKNGRTAFFYAANKINIDILNMLISASKDPESDLNRRYNDNKPLTHIVLEKINDFNAPDVLKFLEFLHENGVRVDLTDAYGETPLHIAARKDSAKNIVEWLIHNGCDPQQMNASERTVFSVADKKIIPVIIKAYNEEESIKAIEESRIYKEELEKEEMMNRRTARDLHLATRTPSETDEKKIESKKRTKLLAMTKRGGTLRTPTLSKGSKFTPVKKLEARPWGGSKQTAKFQRDTRLKIRKVKKDILDQLTQLREDIQKIKKKIDIEAGNISESDHSNDENYEEDNENDIDSYQNSLPQPGTNYRNNDSHKKRQQFRRPHNCLSDCARRASDCRSAHRRKKRSHDNRNKRRHKNVNLRLFGNRLSKLRGNHRYNQHRKRPACPSKRICGMSHSRKRKQHQRRTMQRIADCNCHRFPRNSFRIAADCHQQFDSKPLPER